MVAQMWAGNKARNAHFTGSRARWCMLTHSCSILFVSSSYTVNPSLYAKPPYDPDKDFAPVTKAAGSPNGLFVHPSIPAKSVKELVELIKANPGKYTFASPDIGTTPHLSSELFKLTFGLDFALAPFPGGGPSIQSVVAGHTPMCFQAIPPATSLVKDGKLRALLVSIDSTPLSDESHVHSAVLWALVGSGESFSQSLPVWMS